MNKVIFLDVDGVLNDEYTLYGPHKDGFQGLDPDMCDQFARVVHETKAVVVLSSTWRIVGGDALEKLERWLADRGVKIHSHTPALSKGPWGEMRVSRGTEVQLWLEAYRDEFPGPRILILDDVPDFTRKQLPFLVLTDDRNGGLTQELADKAIAVLMGT